MPPLQNTRVRSFPVSQWWMPRGMTKSTVNCKKVREAKQQLKRTGSGTDVHGESNKKRRLSDGASLALLFPRCSCAWYSRFRLCLFACHVKEAQVPQSRRQSAHQARRSKEATKECVSPSRPLEPVSRIAHSRSRRRQHSMRRHHRSRQSSLRSIAHL